MSPAAFHAAPDAVMHAFAAFDPSAALDAVLACDERVMVARTAAGLPPYLVLEALAQACGLHLRRRHDFMVRAYLASVSDLVHDFGSDRAALTIRATLVAETSAGAAYDAAADGAAPCRMLMGRAPLAAPDTFFRRRFEALCTRS